MKCLVCHNEVGDGFQEWFGDAICHKCAENIEASRARAHRNGKGDQSIEVEGHIGNPPYRIVLRQPAETLETLYSVSNAEGQLIGEFDRADLALRCAMRLTERYIEAMGDIWNQDYILNFRETNTNKLMAQTGHQ